MAYDENLADRIRRAVSAPPRAPRAARWPRGGVTEKEMFGGVAFLLDGKMFVGIVKDELMVRVGPDRYEAALAEPNVRPMDFTGKPMNGYVFVGRDGCRTARAVGKWVGRGAEFVATLEKPARAAKKRRPSTGSRRSGR